MKFDATKDIGVIIYVSLSPLSMHVAPRRFFGAIPELGVIFCKAIILKRQEKPLYSILGLFITLSV